MKLMRHTGGGHYEIRSVAPGRIRVDEEELTTSFVVSPDRLVPSWPPRSLDQVTDEHWDALLELDPEVVLLGTGDRIRFPDARVFARFQSRGIGFEVMDTAAACRTYNVLVSEERRVVAAVML